MRPVHALLALSIGWFSVGALAQTLPPTSRDAIRADREKVRAGEAALQKDR